MDLVYLVKKAEVNIDLVYSLRSVCAHELQFGRVWMAGYTPGWTQNVGSIPTEQNHPTKWLNSYYNLIAACHHPEVSEDFVLMNDDFVALRHVDLERDLNVCGTSLQSKIAEFEGHSASMWKRGFTLIYDLLHKMHAQHFMNFGIHLPMIINKRRFLEINSHPKVVEYLKLRQILPFRSLYGNLAWTSPVCVSDVKVPYKQDIPVNWTDGQWVSTFDNVLGSPAYPRLYKLLLPLATKRCCYERAA